MLKEYFVKIFKNYQSAKYEKFIEHPLVKLIQEDIPQYLEEITPNSNSYVFKGNAGKGNYTQCPSVAILDKKITDGVGKGYFVIYIFSKDTKRLYLSLNQAILGAPEDEVKKKLLSQADEYRDKIGELSKNFTVEKLSLGNPNFYSRYEFANICAKEYSLDNLPTDEELERDLIEILDLYKLLYHKIPQVWQISPGSIRRHEQEKFWPLFKENGYIGIGWLHDSHSYLEFKNMDELKEALIKFYPEYQKKDPSQAAKMVWDFTYHIKKGDIIIANAGFKQIKGIGIVKSDYIDPKNPENPGIFDYFWHLRKIDWKIPEEIELKENIFTRKTLKKIDAEEWNDIKKAYIENNPGYYDKFREMEGFEIKGIRFYLEKIGKILSNDSFEEKKLEKIFNSFYHYLREISGDKYILNYSLNHNIPYISIRHRNKKLYVEYVVREDKKGIYLSISHGILPMRDILSGNGPKIGLKSQKEINSFVNRAEYRINQIREQISISKNFSPKMDINAKKATSGPLYEVCSIYSKYYSFDNLPTEKELISDLKELIKIYEDLMKNEDPKVNFKQHLEKIFKELPSVWSKNEKVKGHPIGKVFYQLSNDILKIADNLHPEKDYHVEPYYRHADQWYKRPYVYIEDRAHKNIFGTWDQHFVGFWFTEDLTGVYLVLDQGLDYARNLLKEFVGDYSEDELHNYIQKHLKETKKFLTESGNISEDLLKESPKAISWDNNVLFGRYYSKNNLPSNEKIVSDFEELFNLYSQLKPDDGGNITVNNETFFKYLTNKGYFFNLELVENFLLSLKVKPFVILTGNSGTGKTKVAQLFAQYLNQNKEEKKSKKEPVSIKSNKVISKKIPINSYLIKNRGGWVLNVPEKTHLKDFSDNFTLALFDKFKNRLTIGQGYIKNDKLFCFENNDFYNYIKNYGYGDKTIYLIKDRYNPNLDLNNYLVKDEEFRKNYEIVPVGANWTENRHIIGFYNVITREYNETCALNLILSAGKDIKKPYFIILDEMNLSHVERYFSDFLSAIESGEEIELHRAEETELEKNIREHPLPPEKINLSKNLVVIGTVNVDETTYMFSPKVLDRANTLEFLTQPAEEYMNGTPEYSVEGDIEYLLNPLSDLEIREKNILELKNLLNGIKTNTGSDLWDALSKNINSFQLILKEADFDFGFRTINEIVRFMYVAWCYENKPPKWDNWERYFDAQIMQKMLPKLHGSQKELSGVLDKLEKHCNSNYPISALKLNKMIKTLKEKRYVAFTG